MTIQTAPTVSVVVPFRNGAPHLPVLLDSLARQDCAEPWELVAVDNGSTDDSRAIVDRYAAVLRLSVVTAPGRANPSYARNVGSRAALGSKLIFIDADDEVSSNYIEALSRALDRHPLVTSRVDSATLNAEWIRTAHGGPWQSDGVETFFDFRPAAGVNIGVRRDVYEQLGGFPEAFSCGEDIAFSWMAQKRGHAIHFAGEAVYRYRYRPTLAGLFRQCANWGRGTVLLYRQFRDEGMPGRPLTVGLTEWREVAFGLLRPGGRAERPSFVVRAGFCWGRLHGSVRYRVRYL